MLLKEDLLKELDSSYTNFLSSVATVDEPEFFTKWLDGRWGVREIVAHHTGWLGQFAGGLNRVSRGQKLRPADRVDWHEIDTWNETFTEHAKGKGKDQVMNELEQAKASFEEAMIALPEGQIAEETLKKITNSAGTRHFREHVVFIRQWTQQRSTVGPRTSTSGSSSLSCSIL